MLVRSRVHDGGRPASGGSRGGSASRVLPEDHLSGLRAQTCHRRRLEHGPCTRDDDDGQVVTSEQPAWVHRMGQLDSGAELSK